jgi:hypothetical protein
MKQSKRNIIIAGIIVIIAGILIGLGARSASAGGEDTNVLYNRLEDQQKTILRLQGELDDKTKTIACLDRKIKVLQKSSTGAVRLSCVR